ncbi:MAG: hypothetical protein FK733_10965 [Asgard group archaeon]|nr:hypothetical protein [Asgard group archaeon]
MSNETKVRIKLKYAFYGEALLNTIMVILCIFIPQFFIRQLTSETSSTLSLEMVIWYGILLFVITFIMTGILIIENQKAFKIVMIGYLFGDWFQIGAAIHFAIKLNSWTFGIIFTIVITAVLIILRFIVIFKPQFLGFKYNNDIKENEN